MMESKASRTSREITYKRALMLFYMLFIWAAIVTVALVFIHLGLPERRGASVLIVGAFSAISAFASFLLVRRAKVRDIKIVLPYGSRLLRIAIFLFSPKTQKEVFEPLMSDWQEEYFSALSQRMAWKSRWINFRYTMAFVIVMIQKSPVGDCIKFFTRIFK